MAKLSNTNIMVLVIIEILLFYGAKYNVVGQCDSDMQSLVTQCAMYVEKFLPQLDPSEGCCNVIKSANFPCVCQHITQAVLQIIDINKVVYVAKTCGKPLPSGTNCGGITRLFNLINFV
ncbi:putative bifunctional inhibitor/plant lipid transfer protein/seed storage helical [Lupinus albus]|uniref:Putative bifunctional inhibitor/plant lipid transfer protein/seed storage helical n=1 Tax=Lupinus albus TaxID=3870 RepID=A0A6A4QSP7_LUPAL|nr:putative bifunctional inhibitor/plant lipid transfer protein/seed storage helical [Lupinus albus]